MICDNIGINAAGHITFAGVDTVDIAKEYKTPLYIMDEDKIREKCGIYVNAFKKYFGENALPLYASKAASFKRMYEIVTEEGMGIDVVSSGEIFTALKAGVDLKNAYFHSNNKTDEDIAYAIDNGIGYFVVDNAEELNAIEAYAASKNIVQNVLLRLTPGIDPHTYEAVSTGKVDSKFGTAIETGQACEIVEYALKLKNVKLCGFHCHIGSQVFDSDTFFAASEIMIDFIADMKYKFGFSAQQLNLGGGYGVRYTENDPVINIDENIKNVSEHIKKKCAEKNVDMPKILMEPGRSIAADAGMTLYTVGTVKKITGYKNYVSIDGGMTDNPRYALYKSKYTLFLANRANETKDFECAVVGRCCESGDIIQENVLMPEPNRGDVIAVATTGAYNYAMSSNYNKIPRPAIVMIKDGKTYTAVKAQTFEDLSRYDV